ncbi:anhydro-N-acetylmuramic acid kinase [Afifella pfennigii]|uniref:anhydro-N-acetylmuramic acid kinase n=1 Tax=Afifella pfennigii TaxID=209897 RepID=UPI000AF41F0A|nr:anhydro-N-acetylmuramic acid kinase [Afifella pfennigii]
MAKICTSIGIISGTSMDGVDVALLRSDGVALEELGPTATYPLPEADRALLRRAMAAARQDQGARTDPAIAEAERAVNATHEAAVRRFVSDHGVPLHKVDCVGFHGQTIFHAPERGVTVQLGDGAALARRLGRPVAWDFRSADMAAGGEGAPLVPVYHQALALRMGQSLPIAFVNIGGVANLTYVGEDGTLIAFDTGPGNAPIDDLVRARLGRGFDADGELSDQGSPDKALLEEWMRHPFFARPAPKSLDRDDFTLEGLDRLTTQDAAASLAAFCVAAIARGTELFPAPCRTFVVCGGGRRNRGLMRLLAEALAPAEVAPAESFGFDGDAVEAQAFAYMALRVAEGLPLTFPGTTGVQAPMPGGRWSEPVTVD